MQTFLLSTLSLAALALVATSLADEHPAYAPPQREAPQGWRYGLPPSLITPSFIRYSAQLPSDARNDDSRFGMQQVEMEIPLSDPRKSGYANWLFLASLNMSYTHIDSTEQFTLKHDDLWRFTLPVGTMLRREKDRFMVMLSPSLASDFETLNSSFTFGGFFLYSRDYKENFSYSLGAGYFPRSFLFGFVPFVNFSWDITPDWVFALERTSLDLSYKLSEKQTLSAFMRYDGESWTIHTERGARNLSVSSVVTGLRWEYNIAPPKVPKRLIRMELGIPLYTDVDIEYRHGDNDSEFDSRYKPTLFLSLGLDMRF